jgi:hypothetical protein
VLLIVDSNDLSLPPFMRLLLILAPNLTVQMLHVTKSSTVCLRAGYFYFCTRVQRNSALMCVRTEHLFSFYTVFTLLAPIRVQITAIRTSGGALCGGADGPWPGTGAGSYLTSRTVRVCIGAAEFAGSV